MDTANSVALSSENDTMTQLSLVEHCAEYSYLFIDFDRCEESIQQEIY